VTLDRREFLKGIGAVLAGGAVVGRSLDELLSVRSATAAAIGPTLPAGTPVVVVIDLAGGHDVLNTHIPWNVPTTTGLYRGARPNMSVKSVISQRPYGPPPDRNYLPPGLDLDGAWAFHGSLPWLANRWWDRRDVAIVQGTGEDVSQEMSHFASMNFRWTGAFGGPLMATGWLGRYNDLLNTAQPLGGISLAGLSASLNSVSTPAVSITDIATFAWNVSDISDRTRWLTDMVAMGDTTVPATMNKARTAALAIRSADAAITRVRGITVPGGSGSGSLTGQLNQAAALISAGIPCQTYVATMGGWDLHSGAIYSQWDQLRQLNAALSSFFGVIDASSRASDVFVLITSEFGRQVSENAGVGTDHGRASSSILVGGGVKGGLYGLMPNLATSSRFFDALVPTVDFRSVYATVLNRLGKDTNLTTEILGTAGVGYVNDLSIFTSGPVTPPPGTAPPPSSGTVEVATSSTGAIRLNNAANP
jgi:uncharacterized protein (DUF1501 family)